MNSNLLKQALVSEKSFKAISADKFTFIVGTDATKESVAAIVADVFNVEVLHVNMIRVKGKVKRGKKGMGTRSDFKKAILTLKKGSKIDLFEVEKADDKKKDQTKDESRKSKVSEKEKISDTKITVRSKKEMPRKVI